MTASRPFRLALAIIAILLFVVGLLAMRTLVRPETPRMGTAAELSASLERFPAHLSVYRAIADQALDLPQQSSTEVWHEAYGAVVRLAPNLSEPRESFVRQGFFHWPELNDRDRQLVLREAALLMRDPRRFAELHRPLWQLTKDFDYLRGAAPREIDSWQRLIELAAQNGQFDHYRQMRDQLPLIFIQSLKVKERRRPPPEELLNDLLRLDRSARTRDAMRTYLDWFAGAPPTAEGVELTQLAAFLDYAIEYRIPGLEALAHLAEEDSSLPPPVRARLALATNNKTLADRIERNTLTRSPEWTDYLVERATAEAAASELAAAEERLRNIALASAKDPAVLAARADVASRKRQTAIADKILSELEEGFPPATPAPDSWSGLCAGVICVDDAERTVFTRQPTRTFLVLSTERSDDVHPYIEIYLDDLLVVENTVSSSKLDVPVPPGLHRLRVHLANRVDRSGGRRIVRIN